MITPHDELMLRRALQLAWQGPPATGVNPPVGAVLATPQGVLAEGWHIRRGGPHAEVLALGQPWPRSQASEATLYVTLEPCCHWGHTPPCAHRVVAEGIRRVVVGCTDPNPQVAGGGLRHLAQAGVQVLLAPQPGPYRQLIRTFWVNQALGRPYVILKWAQTAAGVVGLAHTPLPISGPAARRHGHRLRATVQAVAVGSGTFMTDGPRLTTRLVPGANPQPVVLGSRVLPLPPGWLQLGGRPLGPTLQTLYRTHGIGTLLVEGGPTLHTAFISEGFWDECHILHHHAEQALPDGTQISAPPAPAGTWHTWPLDAHDQLWVTFAPHLTHWLTQAP